MTARSPSLLIVTSVMLMACGADLIPNTDVPNTGENREVLEFVERYRHAIEERSPEGVLALVSDQYFDDNGSLDGNDDMDYDAVRDTLIRWQEDVRAVRYEVRYRRVSHNGERIMIDFTYTGSFKLRTADGDRWSRRLADNRVELIVDSQHGYKIVAGL